MPDNKYCYPNSDVLINKLNITDAQDLFEAEKTLTFLRLSSLQINPIKGNFDFAHLKAIHQYIFQDIYEWAGKERTVEIGKGNLFCTTRCIPEYASSVFSKYFSQCYNAKDDYNKFIKVLAENYGDLNALHPFREGNGRAQREFARVLCLECGYDFNLSCSTHEEMLNASILSFSKYDNSKFVEIFSKAVKPLKDVTITNNTLKILSSDDLFILPEPKYDYYESESVKEFDKYYSEKIRQMDEENNDIENDDYDYDCDDIEL